MGSARAAGHIRLGRVDERAVPGAPVGAVRHGAREPRQPCNRASSPDIHHALAKLDPSRKHYQWYYSTPEANAQMRHCRQGIHAFLRAYFHMKSADWSANKPFPLAAWTADELAKLPTYYVMELH